MFKKLFVLFIVLVLVIVLLCLFLYDKNILEAEALENEENITEENLQDTQDSTEEEMLGRIIIEKISLDAPIKEGSSNEVLKDLFDKAGLILVDYKLEFGKYNGQLILGDEFSPDGCRLWDKDTRKKLDKDRFRQGLGGVIEAYEEVARRIGCPL